MFQTTNQSFVQPHVPMFLAFQATSTLKSTTFALDGSAACDGTSSTCRGIWYQWWLEKRKWHEMAWAITGWLEYAKIKNVFFVSALQNWTLYTVRRLPLQVGETKNKTLWQQLLALPQSNPQTLSLLPKSHCYLLLARKILTSPSQLWPRCPRVAHVTSSHSSSSLSSTAKAARSWKRRITRVSNANRTQNGCFNKMSKCDWKTVNWLEKPSQHSSKTMEKHHKKHPSAACSSAALVASAGRSAASASCTRCALRLPRVASKMLS